jgi:GT2 family glycosyltransferase/SAM-dependent methyltransferase
MKFTGERYLPSEEGKLRLEHYHRYALVMDLVKAKDVLDVASGEGYGSFLMSSSAKTVTGVDISLEAVKHASAKYQSGNIKFLQGSATELNFPDSSFDVVISFETLEHLSQQTEMISELRRVLKPEGCLVISSPNRPIYSEESGEHNEYHVKELNFIELDDLLRERFESVQYYGQRMLMGSVIQSLEGGENNYKAWVDDGVSLHPKVSNLVDAVYFIAVCGMSDKDLPRLDMSVLLPEKLDLVKHYVGFAKWAKAQDQQLAQKDQQLAQKDQQLAQKDQQLAQKDQQLAQKDQQLAQKDQQLAHSDQDTVIALQSKLDSLLKSTSWRITLPIREIKRWIISPSQQICRYQKALSLRVNKFKNTYKRHHDNLGHLKQLFTKGFPSVKDPKVSIIIPVYGKLTYTLRCLASILKFYPQASFEVIVVDDCSPYGSSRALRLIKGIRLIENNKNLGFIRSCNAGASIAHGEYVYFLNNDTKVTLNFLDALLKTFQDFSNVGLVGSKLIYPDGRLQEAGGVIWRDGSAWNFGRLQDVASPIYNYAREVDYCSGASIVIPLNIFNELGGFDEHYLPAYCEDSDLALKIRSKGYSVIYQPLSTVIHYEGITSGTDTGQGIKSYQINNTKKLFERWETVLKNHQLPGLNVDSEKDRNHKYRVLVIDHCTPTPNQDAGSVTTLNLMLLLRQMQFAVTFIPEDNLLYHPDYSAALQRAGVEVLYAPYIKDVEQHLREYGERYDLTFLFRPRVVDRHLKNIRKFCNRSKILFHTIDLHFLRMSREAELQLDVAKQKAADEMKQCELAAISGSDISIVHSAVELEILRNELPNANIHVYPLVMDVSGTNKTFSERKDIVFVGGYSHAPNVDAVLYFVREMMPLLRKKLPGVCFHVIGSNPPECIKLLSEKDIIVHGFVDDLGGILDGMKVAVAPLRYGAGIKGKIGTAMAIGLPVVATTLAVEGMLLTDGETILVADEAEKFTDAIVKLYHDEALWKKISESSIKFADNAWGAEAAWKTLSDIISELGLKNERGTHKLILYSNSAG